MFPDAAVYREMQIINSGQLTRKSGGENGYGHHKPMASIANLDFKSPMMHYSVNTDF